MDITIRHLIKRYGEAFSLEIPSLRIERGEAVGLVGNNGAGKTTFLRLLLDLIEADAGQVLIDNHDVTSDASWKQHVGSYLDESFLIDFLTAQEFLDFVGSTYGCTKQDVEHALASYSSFLAPGVLASDAAYLRDLSTGNRKKVGIVAAMLVEPRLLILDEPFANLDPGSQIRLKELLQQLRQQHDTTLLLSSHDLGHVTDVCERIALLDEGAIVRDLQTSDATLRELEAYFADAMRVHGEATTRAHTSS